MYMYYFHQLWASQDSKKKKKKKGADTKPKGKAKAKSRPGKEETEEEKAKKEEEKAKKAAEDKKKKEEKDKTTWLKKEQRKGTQAWVLVMVLCCYSPPHAQTHMPKHSHVVVGFLLLYAQLSGTVVTHLNPQDLKSSLIHSWTPNQCQVMTRLGSLIAKATSLEDKLDMMKMHLCLHTGGKWWEHARYWKYAGQTSGANIGPIFHFPKYHHIFLVVWRPVLWFTRFSGMNIRTSTGRHTWSDTGRCIDVINLKF